VHELIRSRVFFAPQTNSKALLPNEGTFPITNRRSSTPIAMKHPVPTGTIEFKCIRINLKKTSTFKPDESKIDSLVEFDFTIDGEALRGLKAEVRQQNGTDFQSHPLEVGQVISYNGPWNHNEFQKSCQKYYRDVIGSCGIGLSIEREERNLVERVAIRFYRCEEMALPSVAAK
jgi:hypothetical protein